MLIVDVLHGRVVAPGRGRENAHVTVDMKGTCVMSVLNCTLKSKMKILKPNVQVSHQQVLFSLQANGVN